MQPPKFQITDRHCCHTQTARLHLDHISRQFETAYRSSSNRVTPPDSTSVNSLFHPCPSGTYNLSSVFSTLLLKKTTVFGQKLLLRFLTMNSLQAWQRKPCCLGKCRSVSPIILMYIFHNTESSKYYAWPQTAVARGLGWLASRLMGLPTAAAPKHMLCFFSSVSK